MAIYVVRGTIELNWEWRGEADNEDDAIDRGCLAAEDGEGLNIPVCSPDPDECQAERVPPVRPQDEAHGE